MVCSNTMTTETEILDNLGINPLVLDQTAATVNAYTDLVDRTVDLPSTIDVYGTKVHRFQIVKEEIDLPMESGSTEWVVTSWDSDEYTITMKVPGPWDQQTISFEEFAEGPYEPLYNGDTPLFGY